MLNIEFQSPDAAKTTTLQTQTPTPLGMTSDPVSFTLPSSHFFSHDTPSEPPQYKAKQQANVVLSVSFFLDLFRWCCRLARTPRHLAISCPNFKLLLNSVSFSLIRSSRFNYLLLFLSFCFCCRWIVVGAGKGLGIRVWGFGWYCLFLLVGVWLAWLGGWIDCGDWLFMVTVVGYVGSRVLGVLIWYLRSNG